MLERLLPAEFKHEMKTKYIEIVELGTDCVIENTESGTKLCKKDERITYKSGKKILQLHIRNNR